jgi:hypothetical protein
MVSDHAELFGEIVSCTTPGMSGYSAWQCRMYRRWPRAAYYWFNYWSSQHAKRVGFCGKEGEVCLEAAIGPWRDTILAAENANVTGPLCEFSSFVGYEWTGGSSSGGSGNLHRNVVFRNATVPEAPISFIEEPTEDGLYAALDEQCNNAQTGCQALVIPHNSNLSAGLMFDDNLTRNQAETRQRLEPLVEIMQHKGASECFFDPLNTRDELCAFEQLPIRSFTDGSAPRAGDGFLREVLRDGLALEQGVGANPFKLGFVGSSDTHLGAAGAVEEGAFLGHGGAGKPAGEAVPHGLPDFAYYNPGGLAVLWAEENTREALFEAMLRREAYATSGPRIVARFYGGWELDAGMCSDPEFVAAGYRDGVPMGGTLPVDEGTGPPVFAVFAQQDTGTEHQPGTPLLKVQIIKGWVDLVGNHHEAIYDVARANEPGRVDPGTCLQSGAGASTLCRVWRDPQFDPEQAAYYYARVLEGPSCRWSQRMCIARRVDCSQPETVSAGLEACCDASHRPVIHERAWTSPVWYSP